MSSKVIHRRISNTVTRANRTLGQWHQDQVQHFVNQGYYTKGFHSSLLNMLIGRPFNECGNLPDSLHDAWRFWRDPLFGASAAGPIPDAFYVYPRESPQTAYPDMAPCMVMVAVEIGDYALLSDEKIWGYRHIWSAMDDIGMRCDESDFWPELSLVVMGRLGECSIFEGSELCSELHTREERCS